MYIKPFDSDTNLVITDNDGNELNFEYYVDEIAVYGNFHASGWDDPQIKSIIDKIEDIALVLPDAEDKVPEDFVCSLHSAKNMPLLKLNFTAYFDDGTIKIKLLSFVEKIRKRLI